MRSWLFGRHKSGVMNAWRLEFIQLFRVASLQTLQTKIATIITAVEDCERPVFLDISMVCGRPSCLSVSSSTPATFSSLCAHFGLTLPRLRSVLRVSCSLLSNGSSLPFVQFCLEIEPVVSVNVRHYTAPKRYFLIIVSTNDINFCALWFHRVML